MTQSKFNYNKIMTINKVLNWKKNLLLEGSKINDAIRILNKSKSQPYFTPFPSKVLEI